MGGYTRRDSDETLDQALGEKGKQTSASRSGRLWPVVAALARFFAAFRGQWSNRPTDERNDSLDFAPKWQGNGSFTLRNGRFLLSGMPLNASGNDRGESRLAASDRLGADETLDFA
jgi:hypothetical protein